MASNWQDRAAEKRARIQASIPKEWLVQNAGSKTSAVDLIASSDLLTPKEVEITRSAATDLVRKMSVGELTSVEVTLAFCKRAALVHQAVSIAHPSEMLNLTLSVHLRQTASTNFSQKLLWHKQRSSMPTLPRIAKRWDPSMDCRFP
jgi:amidase